MIVDAASGKLRRLSRILSAPNPIIVPVDDNLISGSTQGAWNLRTALTGICAASPDAILCFKGAAALLAALDPTIPIILNLTASTVHSDHTRKVQPFDLVDAIRVGADAVACHINLSSPTEHRMLKTCGRISRACNDYGVPLMVIIYPRRVNKGRDDNYELLRRDSPEEYAVLISHCVRLADEMGADLIKTSMAPSVDLMKSIIAHTRTPVLVAGGPLRSQQAAIALAGDAIASGARGISFGRNIFLRKKPGEMIEQIRARIALTRVHADAPAKEHR
jgi:DhnA family fructose-bisphosphate aldolase class Ia